jgi:phage terminase large subunit-like protein
VTCLPTRRVKICLPQDPGQAGLAQVEFYTKLLNGFMLDISPESGMGKGGAGLGKQTRAKPFAVHHFLSFLLFVPPDGEAEHAKRFNRFLRCIPARA